MYPAERAKPSATSTSLNRGLEDHLPVFAEVGNTVALDDGKVNTSKRHQKHGRNTNFSQDLRYAPNPPMNPMMNSSVYELENGLVTLMLR